MSDSSESVDLEKLLADAKAATPGRWKAQGSGDGMWDVVSDEVDKDGVPTLIADFGTYEANARHIANCFPGGVVALVERLQRAEAHVHNLEESIRSASRVLRRTVEIKPGDDSIDGKPVSAHALLDRAVCVAQMTIAGFEHDLTRGVFDEVVVKRAERNRFRAAEDWIKRARVLLGQTAFDDKAAEAYRAERRELLASVPGKS